MAEQLTIPAGAAVSIKTTKNGKPITCFPAMHNGALLPTCEAWGDHKAAVEAAMAAGTPIELMGAPEHDAKWNRWSVKIPGGQGGAFGGSKYGGGQQRPWTPQGYRGTPLSADEYWATVTDAAVQAKQMLATVGLIAATSPGEEANLVQDFVAMYMIAIERNVTVIPGHEPKAGATAAAPAVAVAPAAMVAAPQNGVNSVSEYAAQIASATTAGKCDLIKTWVLADTALTDDVKVALQMDLLRRKRALTAAGSA